jgi:PAS domain S-box-containing protein
MEEKDTSPFVPASSDSWRKLLLEQALDAVVAIDVSDIVVEWNHHAEIIFGYSKEEALGRKLTDLIIPKEYIQDHQRGIETFLKTGVGAILNQRIEVVALHRTECTFPVELTVIPVRVEGKLLFYSFLRDISERKKAENLQKNLDTIFSQVMVGIAQTDLTGKFELVNDKYCQLLSRPKEELFKYSMQDLTHPEDLAKNFELFKNLLETGESFNIKKRYLRPDNSFIWVNNTVSLIKNPDGTPAHVVAISQDLSEKMASEEAVRVSEERFRLMVEAVKDYAIFMLDPNGFIRSWNSGAEQIKGYTAQEILGQHFSKFYPQEAIDRKHPEYELEVAKKEGRFEEEGWMVRKDGSVFWANVVISVMRNADGELVGFSKVTRDLSERKKAQEVLREREERLDLAQRAGKLGTFEWNIREDRITWSKELILLYGKDLPSLPVSYQDWLTSIHPDDTLRVEGEVKKALGGANEINVEFRIKDAEGNYRWFLTRADIYQDAFGKPERMVGVKIDISDKKKQEEEKEELQKREKEATERLHSLFMQAPVAVCILQGPNFVYQMVNPSYRKIIGNRDYLGKATLEALPEIIDQPIFEVLKKAYKSGEPQYGNEFPMQLVQADESFRQGFYNFVFQPTFGASGEVEGIFVLGYEVTDHVLSRRSLEKTADELRQAVNARDEFLSVASHELKTPLTSLKLQTQMRQKAVQKGNENAFTLEKMKKMFDGDARQIQRLNRLIDDMLDISRISAGHLVINEEEVDVCRLIKDLIERYEDSLKASGCNITIEDCPAVRGYWDPFRIEQVFSNVLTNAMKYARGKPVIISFNSSLDSILISIQDKGKGIAQENLQRIFERFERATSYNDVSGLGLGLFISRQIVDLHGGRMWAESELGRGSTFNIELPLKKVGIRR